MTVSCRVRFAPFVFHFPFYRGGGGKRAGGKHALLSVQQRVIQLLGGTLNV